ncbi:hypothetical protein [Kitasatospora sp. NPDC059327]|uniref:hypothetical protein n=1 Tax=Kitasatospora sp. NPDC059327 TaxID=3346803 RepID=UPI0036B032AC
MPATPSKAQQEAIDQAHADGALPPFVMRRTVEVMIRNGWAYQGTPVSGLYFLTPDGEALRRRERPLQVPVEIPRTTEFQRNVIERCGPDGRLPGDTPTLTRRSMAKNGMARHDGRRGWYYLTEIGMGLRHASKSLRESAALPGVVGRLEEARPAFRMAVGTPVTVRYAGQVWESAVAGHCDETGRVLVTWSDRWGAPVVEPMAVPLWALLERQPNGDASGKTNSDLPHCP